MVRARVTELTRHARLQPHAAGPANSRRLPLRHGLAMNRLIAALFLISASVNAATFEDRVNAAYAALETEQGEAYEKKLRPFIQETIKKCAPAGSVQKQPSGKIVLVADVSAEGKIFNSIVKPETSTAKCISKEFSARILPAPPNALIADGMAPLIVEIFNVP